MSSIIEGYNYDIFISYRQKDNKHDGWVTEFVNNLKGELESTFKEEISVYFDINPHDGLLETHDVDASLKDKLKCLVFIPIISRTYCDPKSFAWEHEFKAFVDQVAKEQFGLKVKLTNGNVANRVLPIRIHDLDISDIKECELVLGGVLRGIEFIYKEPGVNKPLTFDDDERKNLNNAKYRIQINKTANAIKEIISGLKNEPVESASGRKEAQSIIDKPLAIEKSIIVLPFENMSSDPEQEYFSDGLTEEIITDLSHIHDLLVISRNSAMTFKGTKKKTKEIAIEVKVRYLLEGSVRKSGNKLRIIAQLIDAFTDTHLWAQKYSGTLDDVFDIQEKVSRSIVDSLKIKLTIEERQEIFARPINNPAAFELHIRARHEMWQATEEGLDRSLNLIKEGLEIIGENEILYADAGQIYIFYTDLGLRKEENLLVKADESIQKVFTLNPRSPLGHYLRGMINRKKSNTLEAVREFKQSIAIDSNNPDSLAWLSWVYSHSGKASAARPLIDRLLEIDLLNPMVYFFAGLLEVMDGKFDVGLKKLNKGQQMQKENPVIRYWIAKALAYGQNYEEAIKLLDQIQKESPGSVWDVLGSFFKFALQNNKSEALQILSEEYKMMMKEDEMFPIWIAESYSLLNEKNEAIAWLENGVKSGFINYRFIMEYDLFLENIRGEDRFKKLMERVKYDWENFEV
jgi:TolB-like protein/predicted Zn-dependent protease